MYIPSGRPMTPRELKSWIKYHATRGAYCPVGCDGHKLNDKLWIWVLAGCRIYFICEECALNYRGGHNVLEPDEVEGVLASRQWESGGHGLVLAEGQKPLVDDDAILRREAAALLKRLSRCEGCGHSGKTVVVEIAVRNSRWILSLCAGCIESGPELDMRQCAVTSQLANVMSGGER